MSSRRSDLIVLASRGVEAHAYVGVLQDWSALGLVADFVHVDVDAPRSAFGSTCVAITGGTATAGRLSAIIARRSHTASARVVCLSSVAEEFSTIGLDRAGDVFREVMNALPSANVSRIHAIAVSVPERWPYVAPDDLAWVGAHNVVLAPENAQSPTAGVSPLSTHDRLRPVGLTHQSAALCSAVGLWATEAHSFFDGETPGGQIAAVRSYSRHLALEGTRSEILRRLVDVSGGYPTPATTDGRAQVVPDEAGTSSKMLDSLLALHPEVRPGTRTASAVPQFSEPAFIEAMKLFLRFILGALRGAPRSLWLTLEHEMNTRLGGDPQADGPAVTQTAIVNGARGIKQDGTLASAAESDEEIGRLLAQMRGVSGAVAPERQEYPQFWKDFVDGALTLLDGSKRNKDLEPERIGVGVAVVSQPRAVAADPDEKLRVPDPIRAALGVADISPFDDDLGHKALLLLEEQIKDQPDSAPMLAATHEELRDWFDHRSRSYSGGLGRTLAGDLRRVREEVVGYATQIGRGGPDEASGHSDKQMRLAWILLGFAGVCLALLIGALVIAWKDVTTWRVALGAVVAIAVLWLVISTVIFRKRQRAVFQFLHERQAAASQRAALKSNLSDALVDLRRLQSVYRQYLAWAHGLSVFVRAPLGRVEVAADEEAALGEGFPLNHRFGVVVPEAADLDEVSRQIESQLFKVGWLSDAWRQYMNDLPDFRDRHLVAAEPLLLFNDRPVSNASVLTQWSEAVLVADRTGAAGEIRDGLAKILEAPEGLAFDRLLKTVRARSSQGQQTDLGYGEFVAGLQQLVEGEPDNRSFARAMFAEVVDTAEPWMVDDIHVSGGRGDVRPLIVTERSRVFAARDLAFCQIQAPVVAVRESDPSTLLPPQV